MQSLTRKEDLQGIDAEQAAIDLETQSQCLSYYCWPQVYGNTAGPFSRPGGIAGQAMTTFTMEAWHDGGRALIFCKGRKLDVVDDFDPSACYFFNQKPKKVTMTNA